MIRKYLVDGQLIEVPEEIDFLMKGASRMVGKVLDLIELTMSPGTHTFSENQIEKFKQAAENHMYAYRDSILSRILASANKEEGEDLV